MTAALSLLHPCKSPLTPALLLFYLVLVADLHIYSNCASYRNPANGQAFDCLYGKDEQLLGERFCVVHCRRRVCVRVGARRTHGKRCRAAALTAASVTRIKRQR